MSPTVGIAEAERDGNETFSLSQKAKESLLALAWRENEGKANLLFTGIPNYTGH